MGRNQGQPISIGPPISCAQSKSSISPFCSVSDSQSIKSGKRTLKFEPKRRLPRSKMASGLNNGTRLFRGCRTLLDSLKSTTQAYSSAAAVSPKGEIKASGAAASRKKSEAGEKKEGNRSGGILKSVQVSPALAGFLGMSESSRAEALKQIWSYIKLNNLQNPANKRQINCDEKLKAIFDGRENVGFLEIGKLLSPHFVKSSS